jgi:opacity protein-like surface antigen
MKKLVIVVCLLALASLASAQENKMSIGGLVGIYLPMGDFGDAAGLGFGVLPQFEYKMSPKLNLTGTVGYVMWGGKSVDLGTYYGHPYTFKYTYHDMPILAGAKYYFGEGKMKPYGLAQLGFHMLGVTVDAEYMGVSASSSESVTKLGFGIGGGLEMPINDKMNFDANAAYETIMTEGTSSTDIVIKAGIKYFLQ